MLFALTGGRWAMCMQRLPSQRLSRQCSDLRMDASVFSSPPVGRGRTEPVPSQLHIARARTLSATHPSLICRRSCRRQDGRLRSSFIPLAPSFVCWCSSAARGVLTFIRSSSCPHHMSHSLVCSVALSSAGPVAFYVVLPFSMIAVFLARLPPPLFLFSVASSVPLCNTYSRLHPPRIYMHRYSLRN